MFTSARLEPSVDDWLALKASLQTYMTEPRCVRCAPHHRDRLHIKSEEYAVLLAEPSHNTRREREKTVELLFERFKSPAAFLAKSAVLASFAVGRQTSLVIDSGHNSTTGRLRAADMVLAEVRPVIVLRAK